MYSIRFGFYIIFEKNIKNIKNVNLFYFYLHLIKFKLSFSYSFKNTINFWFSGQENICGKYIYIYIKHTCLDEMRRKD